MVGLGLRHVAGAYELVSRLPRSMCRRLSGFRPASMPKRVSSRSPPPTPLTPMLPRRSAFTLERQFAFCAPRSAPSRRRFAAEPR